MSNRLNQEREQRLQPIRVQRAIDELTSMGYEILLQSNDEVRFEFKGYQVKYFPYSGWHTGKSINDGRGYKHLFNQLRAAK